MTPRRSAKKPDELDLKILQLIEQWLQTRGFPPTVREIMDNLNLSSTSVVDYRLRRLEKWGYLHRQSEPGKRQARALRLSKPIPRTNGKTAARQRPAIHAVTPAERLVSMPLAGRIVASEPIPAYPEAFADETIEVPLAWLPHHAARLYALEVQGDSMIDALVNNGDIVILEEAQEANAGEMVAVWIEGKEESTLKKFRPIYDQHGQLQKIILQPAHPTMPPIEVDDPSQVKIKGKVVLIIRRPTNTPIKPPRKAI